MHRKFTGKEIKIGNNWKDAQALTEQCAVTLYLPLPLYPRLEHTVTAHRKLGTEG